MSAGTAADDSQLIRVDLVIGRMMPDESHGSQHIVNDLTDQAFRLGNVLHGKDRVSSSQERSKQERSDGPRPGLPATAHHQDDTRAVVI